LVAAGAVVAFGALAAGAEIWAKNARLLADDREKTRTLSRVRDAAASFEEGMDGLEQSCRPGQARTADAEAQARLKADPNPDTQFHAARCRRIFAEVLLRSSDKKERKDGQTYFDGARDLLKQIRSEHPDYGGLDEEQREVDAIDNEVKTGVWSTSGPGLAAELAPPQLSPAAQFLDDARRQRDLGDFWRSVGRKDRATEAYGRALARYDASAYSSSAAGVKAERDECAKRLSEVRGKQ
jgi:hypothetical protein